MIEVPHCYPGSSDALPEWEDADVQTVYQMLCDDALNMPPNPEEHWEGWISRNIVRAMRARTGGVAQGAVSCGVTDHDKIETLQKLVAEYKERAIEVVRAEIASGAQGAVAPWLWACTGCGSQMTIDQIKGEHPNALCCCPERRMAPLPSTGCATAAPVQGPKQHGWPVGTRVCDCVTGEVEPAACHCERASELPSTVSNTPEGK